MFNGCFPPAIFTNEKTFCKTKLTRSPPRKNTEKAENCFQKLLCTSAYFSRLKIFGFRKKPESLLVEFLSNFSSKTFHTLGCLIEF
jgi:hypothetical protein